MKISTDIRGELEVPATIGERFRAWCRERKLSTDDMDALEEFPIAEVESSPGKIIPKEEAEFLVSYTLGNLPSGGGYPVEGRTTFEDAGRKYTVIAFSWTSWLEETMALNILAYREP